MIKVILKNSWGILVLGLVTIRINVYFGTFFSFLKPQILLCGICKQFIKRWILIGSHVIEKNRLIYDKILSLEMSKGFISLLLICPNQTIDQGRSYTDITADIYNCRFIRYQIYVGNGGVIYINGLTYYLSITQSMFHDCRCTQMGGAVYFHGKNYSQKMICANECYTGTSSYHFAFSRASPANTMNYVSVSSCSIESKGYTPVMLQIGNQQLNNCNFSMNSAGMYSGLNIQSPNSFKSTHCSFSNHNASDSVCINLYQYEGTISFANIVNNNSPNFPSVIYVSGSGSYYLQYCIFYSNKNRLFYTSTGALLEVSHSFISHEGITSSTSNNSLTSSQSYQHHFFSSFYCLIDTPHQTHERTQKITPFHTPPSSKQPSHPRTFDPQCTRNYVISFNHDITHRKQIYFPILLSFSLSSE